MHVWAFSNKHCSKSLKWDWKCFSLVHDSHTPIGKEKCLFISPPRKKEAKEIVAIKNLSQISFWCHLIVFRYQTLCSIDPKVSKLSSAEPSLGKQENVPDIYSWLFLFVYKTYPNNGNVIALGKYPFLRTRQGAVKGGKATPHLDNVKVRVLQTHNHSLHPLFLTVSWELLL